MKVVDFLAPSAVIPALAGRTKPEVLAELSTFLAEVCARPGAEPSASIDASALCRMLVEREEQNGSTALGDGVAIPHGKLNSVSCLLGVLGRSMAGLEFDSLDGKPTHLVFVLVTPTDSAGDHLKAMGRLMGLFRETDFRRRLLDAKDAPAMYQLIAEEDAKH